MIRTISKVVLAAACLLALGFYTPQAKAASLDFSCGGSPVCNGSVAAGGAVAFTGSGITLSSNFDGSDLFTASFGTNSLGAGTISITENTGDSNSDDVLSGTILSTSAVSFGGDELLAFNVQWTTPAGTGLSTVTFVLNPTNCLSVGETAVAPCSVVSADLHVNTTTPEPASLLLLGTGLLGLGGAVRRRWLS